MAEAWKYEELFAKEQYQRRMRAAERKREAELKAQAQQDARKKLAARRRRNSRPKPKASSNDFVSNSKKIVAPLPTAVRKLTEKVIEDPQLSAGVEAMIERADSFDSPLAAVFAGIAMHDASRNYFDERLDQIFATMPTGRSAREVIIGGGLHAAIYSAVRVAKGFPPPLVLESRRAGGIFAVSKQPSFYLNSRNRPGALSLPGRSGSLNVLPGSLLQAADVGGSEYQTNSALAWVIRTALAMSARVRTGKRVVSIEDRAGMSATRSRYRIFIEDADPISADRVIIATGLNELNRSVTGFQESERLMSFERMMAQMDQTFPLRGMRRVAVIGAGDSGKTAIEALTGQGPSTGWSVASVDWLDQIDWYGQQSFARKEFEDCNRSRYKGLARLMPNGDGDNNRIKPITRRAVSVDRGYDCVYVDEVPYDHVIVCTGFLSGPPLALDIPESTSLYAVKSGLRSVARRSGEIYIVGPAAGLKIGDAERSAIGPRLATSPESTSALFRYAGRTAQLAEELPVAEELPA